MADPVSRRPRLFNFDAQGVRVVGSWESPRFVAKDVCDALGLVWKGSGNSGSLENLDEDEKGVATVDTLGGPQELGTVTESGLYALIFRSRKPSARLFRRWVTSEVLPAIRRTGSYRAPAAAPETALAAVPPALLLPPPPTLDALVARLLYATIRFPRDHGYVHPVEIARSAVVERLFVEVISDPSNFRQVASFLRFITARFARRWLRHANGTLVYLEPVAKGRHRRYSITSQQEGGVS